MKLQLIIDTNNDSADEVVNTVLRIFGVETVTETYTVGDVSHSTTTNTLIHHADLPSTGAPLATTQMGFGTSAAHVQPERASAHPDHAAAKAAGFIPQAAQAAMTSANSVELDKSGCPWDGRIHASPPSINKGDGMWRAKKGVDKAEAEALSTDLRRIAQAGGNHTAAAPAGMPQQTLAQFNPPVHQAAPVETAFTKMMAELAPHVASGAIPQTVIDEAAKRVGAHNNGAGNIALLQHNEALIPQFVAMVNTILAGG